MIDLEVHLSENCNLNCSYCCHFAQLAEEEYLLPADFEKSLSSIRKDVLNRFGILRLMGGEPLLNPCVKEIIAIARKFFCGKIELVTNGILLKKQDSALFRACVDNGVELRITRYPIAVDYNRIVRELHVRFPKLKIADHRDDNLFCHFRLDLSGSQDQDERYSSCRIVQEMFCQQLVGTRIYACPYGAHIRHFNKRFGYDLADEEYLDLANVKEFGEVEKWKGKSKRFCRYCNLDDTKYYPWSRHQVVDGEHVNEYL